MGGIDKVIPVSAYIPGCPASPAAIIDGVAKLLGSLQGKKPGEKADIESIEKKPLEAERTSNG